MTTFIMNSSTSSFHHVEQNEDHDQHNHHRFFGNNHHHVGSSSSYSYQFYFNSTRNDHNQIGYPNEVYHHQPQVLEVNNSICGGSYEVEEKNEIENGLKLSLGNNESCQDQKNPEKWMSSKMRLMHRMKKPGRIKSNELSKNIKSCNKFEDHPRTKQQQLPSPETDYRITNNTSNNSSTTPVRVCADCNTTKTPLWRSGPNGPKSLCNACGIRQRKARRALAAAAAAANGGALTTDYQTTTTTTVKIKLAHKEKTKNNAPPPPPPPQTVPFKKRCKAANVSNASAETSSQQQEKIGFEDFLINLSKNLKSFHSVFPQDEKEAAILLMALSCGLVHG